MRFVRTSAGFAIALLVAAAAAPRASGGEQAQPTQPAPPDSGCIRCHTELAQDLGPQVAEWKGSVHAAVGISCNDCHGGNPSADQMLDAKKADVGYVGAPKKRSDVAPFCAKCHSDIEYMRRYNPSMRVDQLTEYLTSRHGKAVQQEGSDKAATCTDCHGKHEILRVTDPRSPVHPSHVADTCSKCHSDPARVGGAKLPTDIYERWMGSVHGARLASGDLSAPTCNDCHGNHGATPPGVKAVVHVCGRCHVTQEEHFAAGTHRGPFERAGKAPCVTCHGNHDIRPTSDELLGVRPPGLCWKCHNPGDHCDLATHTMLDAITQLATDMDATQKILTRAEELGMDVSDARFHMSDVRDRLTMARVIIHRFSEKDFMEVIGQGKKTLGDIRTQGDDALREWEFRRSWLALSLVFIGSVIVALILKVHRLDRSRLEMELTRDKTA